MIEPLLTLVALAMVLAYPSGAEPLVLLRNGRDSVLVFGVGVPLPVLWTLLAVFVYLAWAAVYLGQAGTPGDSAAGRTLSRRRILARGVALVALGLIVFVFHYPLAVRTPFVTATVILSLLPYFVMSGISAILVSVREGILAPDESVSARMGYGLQTFVAFSLAPVLGLLALFEVFTQYEVLGQLAYVYPFLLWLSFVSLLMTAAFLSPYLLRLMFAASPLEPGPLRDRLEALCARAEFRAADLLVIPSARVRVANAMIVGLAPRARFVFFTDYLLENLRPEQVECVLAHEIAHARKRHLPAFFNFGVASLILMTLILEAVEMAFAGGALAMLALLPLLSLGWLSTFSFISRRFESEADLWGAELTGNLQAFIETLVRVTELNRIPPDEKSFRHPSPAERIQSLLTSRRLPMHSQFVHLTGETIRKICFYWLLLTLAALLPVFARQVKYAEYREEVYQAMVRVDQGEELVKRMQFAAAEPVLASAVERLEEAEIERLHLARAHLYLARARAELGKHAEAQRSAEFAAGLGLCDPRERMLLNRLLSELR
ncbi:MAG TPA: M48 family metallopeptidase [Planctomycetota bacterium]|nr:M48 family metallopeptidase [Planctomycetota bacterium]